MSFVVLCVSFLFVWVVNCSLVISFIDFLNGGWCCCCCCCCCCLGHSLFFALLLSLFPGDFFFSLLYILHAFPSISPSFWLSYVLFASQFNFVFLQVVITLLPWDSFPLFASYTLSTCILILVSLSSLYSACISIHLSSFSFYILVIVLGQTICVLHTQVHTSK